MKASLIENELQFRSHGLKTHLGLNYIWFEFVMQVRVQLIIKKFKIFFGGKTVATIYQIKTKFVNVFGFLYISKCSELTIFGVKVTLKSIDPKFSYLACRILQIIIIYPNKFIDLWLKNPSLNQWSVLVSIWGVKCPWFTFTPLVMTSGEFLTNSRCINHQLSYVFW